MRDFVSKILDTLDHQTVAVWAADCSEHVLPLFEKKHPKDRRPRQAIEAARAWAAGKIKVAEARSAAVATHAAARAAKDDAACAVARAAGQAAAAAHMIGHAIHAAEYALKAVRYANGEDAATLERTWQYQRLLELRQS